MTPQEALAAALRQISGRDKDRFYELVLNVHQDDDYIARLQSPEETAAAILAALPEGWRLTLAPSMGKGRRWSEGPAAEELLLTRGELAQERAEARSEALAEVREALAQLPGIPEAHPRAPTIRHDELYRAAVLAAIDALAKEKEQP